jgi:hypothetical protein
MRSLKDKVIEIVIVAPCERMANQNARKRKEFLYRLKEEANAKWSGRLPRTRAKTDDVFDLILSADISIQQQSPFFTKLPLELRRLIYAYAMGGKELQIELCDDDDNDTPFEMRCAEAQKLLAFPKSCKLA